MLVLSRKNLESLYIKVPPGGTEKIIKVQIVGIGNSKLVRVGIEADRDVTILREELFLLDDKKN